MLLENLAKINLPFCFCDIEECGISASRISVHSEEPLPLKNRFDKNVFGLNTAKKEYINSLMISFLSNLIL